MITLEDLDRIQIFKDLSDSQLKKVQALCRIFEFHRDERLFMEGDPATHMWIVLKGDVELRFELPGRPTSSDTKISREKSREKDEAAKTLGWSCFVPPYKMRLSAYCTTRSCTILKIEKEELISLLEQDPLMGYRVMSYIVKVVGFRFHQFQDEVAKNIGENIMSGW